MNQKTAAVLTILLLAAITSIFIFFKLSGTEISPVISGEIDHKPSPESIESMKTSLAFPGKTIALRAPKSVSWKNGETGSFALGIRNKYSEKKSFFLNIKLESAATPPLPGQAEEWLIYPNKKTIPPLEAETIEIIAKPTNPPAQTYLFRVLVCETPECQDLGSPSIYATTTFSFKII